jgi:hypothetical protein
LLPDSLLPYESWINACGSADSTFTFRRSSDLLRVTSHAWHTDTMFVNEFSAGFALVEKRTRRDASATIAIN